MYLIIFLKWSKENCMHSVMLVNLDMELLCTSDISIKWEIFIALWCFKARGTPMKTITITRLELTAASIAANVLIMVRRELDFQSDKRMFWTNSTSVLKYNNTDKTRYHTFFANRIQVIRKVTASAKWHYVSRII